LTNFQSRTYRAASARWTGVRVLALATLVKQFRGKVAQSRQIAGVADPASTARSGQHSSQRLESE